MPTAYYGTVAISGCEHVINQTGDCPQYARIVEFGGDLQEQVKLR